jgi:hypothetical protein
MLTSFKENDLFKLRSDTTNPNVVHVKIKGMGVVTIYKSDEGVIVDVFDNTDNNDSLATAAVDISTFQESYSTQVEEKLLEHKSDMDVDYDLIAKAYTDGKSVKEAVSYYILNAPFSIDTITGLKGECAGFHDEVRKLNRPYTKIEKEFHEKLIANEFDYYLTSTGVVVTFGAADGGFALMPLNLVAGQEILNNQ